MVNHREILRMTADGYGVRQIKSDAHCSHDTIRETLSAAREKGISWPLADDVTNEEPQEFLFPGKYKSLSIYQIPDSDRHLRQHVTRNYVFGERFIRLSARCARSTE